MKRIAILFGLLIALPACHDDPPPVAQPLHTQTAEQPPEPAPPPTYDFPKEENALSSVQAFTAMPIGPSFVIATGNAEKMWELLDAAEPEVPPYSPDRPPELLDLHPARLEAIGVDPKRPVGIALYGEVKKPLESDKWIIFGTLTDHEKFKEAFQLRDHEGKLATTQENDRRRFVQFENGEFVIASKVELELGEDRGKILGESPKFLDLVASLDYGALGTAYISTKRGTGIYGVGIDEHGLGVKAIAADEIFAARLRLNFARYAVELYPEVPYLNRVINLRGELHASGRTMREEIDAIDMAPRKRRGKAAKDMMEYVDIVGEHEGEVEGRVVQGRVWKVTAEDIARAYQGWVDLGPTPDEIAKRTQLATSLASLEIVSQMDVDEISDKFIKAGERQIGNPKGMENMMGMGGPMTETMMKLGGIMDGGGGKGKGKGKGKEIGGPMGGVMKGLGSFGGFLGGGGSGSSDISVHSKVPEFRKHMQRRRQSLAICWGKSGHNEGFTMRVGLESDVEGRLRIRSMKGAPNKSIEKCVRNTIGTRGPKPKADPEKPDAGVESLRGTVTMKFTL